MEIQVYALAIDRELTDEERDRLVGILPYARYQRLTRARENRQNQAMCAYGLLRHALEEQYGLRTLPAIELSREGKPMFRDRPEIHFNLSHTDGAVLCAVHDHPVGVDIERIRPVSLRTMRRLAGVDTEEAFFQCWVRREARTKRTGTGVSTMMREETPLQPGERYYEVRTFPGYAAGVATREKDPLGKLYAYSLEEML